MTTYLITGGGRGIGLELTKQLAALSSSSLIITTTRSSAPSEALAAVISAAPANKILHVNCDVMDTDSVARAAKTLDEKLPQGLDVLVNNVGAVGEYTPGAIEKQTTKGMVETFATNVGSAHTVTSAFMGVPRSRVVRGSGTASRRWSGSGTLRRPGRRRSGL